MELTNYKLELTSRIGFALHDLDSLERMGFNQSASSGSKEEETRQNIAKGKFISLTMDYKEPASAIVESKQTMSSVNGDSILQEEKEEGQLAVSIHVKLSAAMTLRLGSGLDSWENKDGLDGIDITDSARTLLRYTAEPNHSKLS